MKIDVVGAGPAGLYLAILAKRANPAHDITVWERNPPDATYGWGVVFSEETLSELRDADYQSYLAFDEALVRWDAIDIHYRDERLRSYGHGFSAIARTSLLALLQQRAAGLGVTLRFQAEIDDPGALDPTDLLVGADGVRSTVRARHERAFGTTYEQHASTYVWFGTDRVFDVFTFVFRETPHGLFQVHAYPFDGQTSTFIVETSVATWQAAGLDRMGEEESLAYCQQLFADHLGDHKLLSNKSLWSRFTTIRNRSWHHDNVVLAGDAAHTAHFTIGSGTKLAMEDAVALAKALEAEPDNLDAAFTAYELERQLPVERFQEAATDSAHYFEYVSRYLSFAPEQFAFNLLTRSGRITRANLELRDPAITNRVDRWFGGARDRIVAGPPVLAPFPVAETTLPNRVVLASVDDPADAARMGAGLVVTRPVAVSPEGRVSPVSAGLWDDDQVDDWRHHNAEGPDSARAKAAADGLERLAHQLLRPQQPRQITRLLLFRFFCS
jgi:anthraniloyl-CoA monooxygenase